MADFNLCLKDIYFKTMCYFNLCFIAEGVFRGYAYR